MKRDEEYKALKQRLSKALIDLVEQHYPGFAEIIDYQELSTPLTNEHFTGHYQGGIYGLAIAPERLRQKFSLERSQNTHTWIISNRSRLDDDGGHCACYAGRIVNGRQFTTRNICSSNLYSIKTILRESFILRKII
ncbi:MAG: hypothetical protein HC784_12770 [Hydrococcus sp. CSU_1_8]|nr:hypothetical protein [Hydrococcus sp. CSU_1_8]